MGLGLEEEVENHPREREPAGRVAQRFEHKGRGRRGGRRQGRQRRRRRRGGAVGEGRVEVLGGHAAVPRPSVARTREGEGVAPSRPSASVIPTSESSSSGLRPKRSMKKRPSAQPASCALATGAPSQIACSLVPMRAWLGLVLVLVLVLGLGLGLGLVLRGADARLVRVGARVGVGARVRVGARVGVGARVRTGAPWCRCAPAAGWTMSST